MYVSVKRVIIGLVYDLSAVWRQASTRTNDGLFSFYF